jgi:hypothetical protein
MASFQFEIAKERKLGEMKKLKKAIGYVCDIPILDTDLVINKDDQRLRILKYAEENNLEIVSIYEDEEYTEPFVSRPGVQKLLNGTGGFDVLLLERVWCLSLKMEDINFFLKGLERKNVQLVTSSYLWDEVSEGLRHHNLVVKLRRDKRGPDNIGPFLDAA